MCRSVLVTFYSLWLIFAVLLTVSGCSTEQYKAEADEEVYDIIDEKWDEQLGRKVNYKINDVEGSPNDIEPANVIPVSGQITLSQAVAIATAQNRNYQTQKESLYLSALDLTLQRHKYVQRWFGSFDAFYQRDSEDEQIFYDTELGFSQLLADGAQVSMGIALDWTRFLTGDPRHSLGSVLSGTITQPLLRGAGRKIVQENLTQSERNVLYDIRSFNRFRKEFIVSVVDNYYRVLQRLDTVKNAENNVKRRFDSMKRLEMEGQAGRRDQFQVDQAKQDWLQAKDNYVSTLERYEQLLDEFKIRLALPTDANISLDSNELDLLASAGISELDYTLEDAIETALLNRLDLANSADRIDDATRKVIVAEDGLGAELNLIGSMNVQSAEKTKFERLQFQDGTYGFGFEGDLPLDRKAERNIYRETLIALARQIRQYDNDRDEVILDVRQAYRQLREAAEKYKIQKNSLILAEKRVESTSMLIEAGRATTRDLLESQDDLLNAQNDLTAALVDHTIAKLNFFRDIEVLQIKPDGMWE